MLALLSISARTLVPFTTAFTTSSTWSLTPEPGAGEPTVSALGAVSVLCIVKKGGINFDYLPQTEESEKLKKWGAGMVQGQVFLKRGEADIFPI